jgi:hypothetical protein
MFWKLFKWNDDLKKLTFGNRAVMQILNIRLIYVFLLMSFVYLFYSSQLAETPLGFALLIGFLGFWAGRTIEQFIFLRVKSTMVTVLTVVFIIGDILHLLPLLIK